MTDIDGLTHKLMVELSGLRPGQLAIVLAGRLAAVMQAHLRSEVLPTHCGVCVEPWPCDTYKIVTGAEVDL